jgi:hypothetical protein
MIRASRQVRPPTASGAHFRSPRRCGLTNRGRAVSACPAHPSPVRREKVNLTRRSSRWVGVSIPPRYGTCRSRWRFCRCSQRVARAPRVRFLLEDRTRRPVRLRRSGSAVMHIPAPPGAWPASMAIRGRGPSRRTCRIRRRRHVTSPMECRRPGRRTLAPRPATSMDVPARREPAIPHRQARHRSLIRCSSPYRRPRRCSRRTLRPARRPAPLRQVHCLDCRRSLGFSIEADRAP